MFYVYLIYSKKTERCYIGCTENLKDRLKRHNRKGNKYTTTGTPWKLIYYEAFTDKKDALEEERFLKTGKGRERREYLLKNYWKQRKRC